MGSHKYYSVAMFGRTVFRSIRTAVTRRSFDPVGNTVAISKRICQRGHQLRTFCTESILPPPQKPSSVWHIAKYCALGSIITATAYGAYLWQVFKSTLMCRLYMTEEELEECRNSAMAMLNTARDTAVPLNENTLCDTLGDKYYSIAQERILNLNYQELTELEKSAKDIAWEYVQAMWELEGEDFDLAFLACRYFLVYTPDQLMLVVASPTAKNALLDGALLTDKEIRDLAWSEGGVSPFDDDDDEDDEEDEEEEDKGGVNGREIEVRNFDNERGGSEFGKDSFNRKDERSKRW